MTEMTEYESLMAGRFAALATPDSGDWLDVRRRARRMKLRKTALVLAATLAAIIVAAPALGLHRVVVDWFEAEPASDRTQLEFLQLGVAAPSGMDPSVIPNSARKVMTARTSKGAYTLSVAPTRAGGFCWQWSDYVGSCTRDRSESYPGGEGDLNASAFGATLETDKEGTVSVVSGRLLGENIERLLLEYDDGKSAVIPFVWVSPPIDAGFYLFEVPTQYRVPGHRATALVATDGEGKEIAHQAFRFPRPEDVERPVRLPGGQRVSLPARAIVDEARKVIDFRAENRRRVTLWVIPTRDGGLCYVHNRGAAAFQGRLKLTRWVQGRTAVLRLSLIAGQVRTDVAIYELRYEDGTVERLEPVESFILHEISSRNYARGHRLDRVRALDREGEVLAQLPVRTDAPGVYPCEKPVDIGHGVMACP